MRHPVRFLFVLLVFISALSASTARAGVNDVPPPIPGWTRGSGSAGILLSGGKVIRSSPVIAEMDGNPADGQEVAVGGGDGILYVYKSNGQLLWSRNVMPGDCTPVVGDNKLNSGPAVGQLFGDSVPYVVIGYGTIQPSNCDGGIVVYRATDGAPAWRFSLRDWAARNGYSEDLYGVVSSPALADTDGDGRMEIGFGGLDRNIYLLNADSSVRFACHAADTVWSSPAFVNIDADPQLEMLIGQDISANPATGWNQGGGFVDAFKTTPHNPPRIPHEPNSNLVWSTFLPAAVFSSPVIADLLSGNPGLEAVIGTSCNVGVATPWLKILRLSDGTVLQTLNAPSCIQSSAAVGDIDGDGQLEVVANVQGDVNSSGTGYTCCSRVVAWKPANPNPIWVTIPRDSNSGINDAYGSDLQSPIIADLDGNGSLEVITANFWSIDIFDGKTGQQLTCGDGATCGSQLTVSAGDMLKSTPAVGDIDNDGKLDLIIGGSHVYANGYGILYGWTGFAGRVRSPSGNQPAYSAPWPIWRGNPRHTGVFVERALRSSLAQIDTVLRVRASTTYALSFSSADGSPISWSVTKDDPSNLVGLNRTSGGMADTLLVALTAPPTSGTYTASLAVQVPEYPSLTIPITVHAATQIFNVSLPLVMR